jgi:hypothetical protein
LFEKLKINITKKRVLENEKKNVGPESALDLSGLLQTGPKYLLRKSL